MSAGVAWHPAWGPVRRPWQVFLLPKQSHGHFQMGLRGGRALCCSWPGTLVLGEGAPSFSDHPATPFPPAAGGAVWSAHSLANTWNSPFLKNNFAVELGARPLLPWGLTCKPPVTEGVVIFFTGLPAGCISSPARSSCVF